MHVLADAIVYLLAYTDIAGVDPDTGQTVDDNRADDDCNALESAIAMLDTATEAEHAALRAAAERAVAQENAKAEPHHAWLAAYEDILTHLIERAAPDEG